MNETHSNVPTVFPYVSLREHSAMTFLDFLYCNGAVEVDECGLSSDTFSFGESVRHEVSKGMTYIIAENNVSPMIGFTLRGGIVNDDWPPVTPTAYAEYALLIIPDVFVAVVAL